MNSKWIKDLNVGIENLKLLVENIRGKKLLDVSLGNDLFCFGLGFFGYDI